MEDCGAQRVALADVRDRRPGEFDAARGRTRSVGQLGRPGTERDEIEPYDRPRPVRRPRAREPVRGARAPPPGRRPPPPGGPRRPTRRAPLCCDPPPPSAVRAPPATRPRCARVPPRAAHAGLRARRAGSSYRSPLPEGRGGIGSCRSPAPPRGCRARPLGAATRVRPAPAVPPRRGSAGTRPRARRRPPAATGSASGGRPAPPAAAEDLAGRAVGHRSERWWRREALPRRRDCPPSGR